MIPTQTPTKLIQNMDRRGLIPTAMQFEERDGLLVGTVTQWGPKHAKIEPEAEPNSRRGVMAASGLPVNKQGALDL